MRLIIRRVLAALSVLIIACGCVSAADSTTAPHPTVSWQAPTSRGLSGVSACPTGAVRDWDGSAFVCTSNIATASGLAGGSTIPITDVTGMPTCSSGYVLTYSSGTYSCVNSVALATVADGVTGMPTCGVGYALTYSDGAYSCVNSVALAATAGNGVASISGTTLTTTDGTAYTLTSGNTGGKTASCSGNGGTILNEGFTVSLINGAVFNPTFTGYCAGGTSGYTTSNGGLTVSCVFGGFSLSWWSWTATWDSNGISVFMAGGTSGVICTAPWQ